VPPPPPPPANWYVDPEDASQWRYWDGATWTGHRAPRTEASASPLVVQPTQVEVTRSVEVTASETTHGPGIFRRVRSSLKTERSAAVTPSNPTLEQMVGQMRHEPFREPLEEQIEVVGETYHVKGISRVFADMSIAVTDSGATIEDLQCLLVPEPWNPHDPNAVAVTVGPHHVGYIPAEMAVNYAPPLLKLAATNTLLTGIARIWAKTDAGMMRARVTIKIPGHESCW
jgi:hypothetical protein